MANTIVLKRSATPGKVPTTSQLSLGEIAINTYDGLIYIKKDDGTPSVVQIGGVTSVNGETGAVTIDTGDVAENGNLYFTNTRARSAISAGSGISYNSSTGAISTAQTLTTAGSPTFVNLTLTGGIPSISGSIIPSADITYDLGSPTKQWKDIYVGPGSLYVNGSKVLEDVNDTITFTADTDQNIRIKTLGTGILQLGSSTTNINIDGTLQIASGKNITDSAGVKVNFGDNIEMNGNKVIGLGAPSSNTDAATKGYVDTAVSAISTSSVSQGNSNITVTDTGTGTVTVTVDGSTALTVDATGVVVAGNFTVSGTTTTVNSATVAVADNILTLNSDATGTPTQNAGIEVERGDDANVQIRWNEGSDTWTFTNDGAVYHPISTSTDVLAEGSTNLYHTTARARGALSSTSATGVSYNSSTGVISLGSIPNSSLTNNSITINGSSVALGGTRTLGTDDVNEGSTNLYHTTARARSSVSAGTGISYNSTTGVISTSAIPNASLSNSSVTVGTTAIALGASSTTLAGLTSVTSTAFVGALTGNADTATSAGKWTTARTITLGGDLTGSVSIDGSAGVTLTATVAANSVALGTDTTGNYMVDLTAGTGITVTHTAGEGSNATVAVDTSTIATKAYVDSSVQGKDNTDEITEGSTNLFFTQARARNSISGGTGVSFNTTTGVISLNTASAVDQTTAQTLTNKSLSDSTTYFVDETDSTKKLQIQVSSITTGTTRTLTAPDESGTIATRSYVDTAVAGKDNTDEITEGSTNLYFTNARARSAVSFTAGSGAYNSTTGVFTIPTNTNQLTNGASYITLASLSAGTGISYNSTTGAISTSAIPNSSLSNSSVTVGTTAISLGSSSTTLAGLTSVTSTGFTGALTGNASTATTLQTARNINGVSFNGSADVTVHTAGTGISISGTTVTNTDLGSSQNIFKNFTDGTTTAAADSNNDTFKFRGSNGVTVAVASDDATHGDSLLVSLSSVPNSSLANSSVTVGSTSISLGSSATTIAGLTSVTSTSFVGALTGNASTATTAGTVTTAAQPSITSVGTLTGLTVSGATATGALTVTGAITATGEVTAYYSDLRLKTNIVPIADALEKVEAISGVTFDPNEDALALGIDDRHQMGVIAQEIEAVAPELVCDSAFAGYKTVRYDKLTALLIEAVKELSAKVKTLEAQVGNTKPQL